MRAHLANWMAHSRRQPYRHHDQRMRAERLQRQDNAWAMHLPKMADAYLEWTGSRSSPPSAQDAIEGSWFEVNAVYHRGEHISYAMCR